MSVRVSQYLLVYHYEVCCASVSVSVTVIISESVLVHQSEYNSVCQCQYACDSVSKWKFE